MDKLFRKFFEILRNLVQFVKILIVFCILMYLLFWIQNLIGITWSWTNFITPIMASFTSIGESLSDGSFNLCGALFEYKYFVALVIMLVLLFIVNKSENLISVLEDKFDDGHRLVKKMNEEHLNKTLETNEHTEQMKIKKYEVYIETSIKKKFAHVEQNVNLEEQNKIMNKFLMEKTGINPKRYKNGFLYSFNRFGNIDSTLKVLFKLIKSNSPLNYYICVQIVNDDDSNSAFINLDKLIDLRFENKICMMSDTAYRYKHNDFHGYGTSSLGIFQKDGDTCEAHEFIEIS